MAKYFARDYVITINNVNLSDHVASVELKESYEDIPTTAFGSSAVTRIAGLGDHSVSLTFHEDFAASSVHQTIYPLVGGTTTISVKPLSSTTNSTNPSFSATVLVNDWPTLTGSVGELAVADVTWPVSGSVTKTTS